jgi:hypothetical protein
MQQFEWRPGIGDPTIGGWFTVLLYFLAVWSTWRTAAFAASGERKLWRAVLILFVGLGINKQLDLQTALTEFGRLAAFDLGWYEKRRIIQLWFVIAVAVVCTLFAIALLRSVRNAPIPTRLALVGTTVVLAYVVIRAASFHHIDRFIGSQVLGLKWNWVLEMSGIATVMAASEWRRAMRRPGDAAIDLPI